MEVQQRSVEYTQLFVKHDALRPGVLEPMPQFERPSKMESDDSYNDAGPKESPTAVDPNAAAPTPAPSAQVGCTVNKILEFVLWRGLP